MSGSKRLRHFGTGYSYFGESGGDAGQDVIFYGDTSGAYLAWDASTNTLEVIGGGFSTERTDTVAAGGAGLDITVTQSSTALTGTLRGLYVTVTNGTSAATGTIRAAELKARAATSGGIGANAAGITTLYLEADVKAKTVTTLRGLEISLDGAAGGSSTLAQGLVIFNNSSATQTSSYALDINGGTLTGHKAFTGDIRFSDGLLFVALTSAITATSTDTTTPAGSIGITSNGTGVGHLFVSDGSKWQYMAVA